MTGRVIPLGRIAGIPIRLDSSWFLIFALVTWTLACPSPKPHPTQLTTADALATGQGTLAWTIHER